MVNLRSSLIEGNLRDQERLEKIQNDNLAIFGDSYKRQKLSDSSSSSFDAAKACAEAKLDSERMEKMLNQLNTPLTARRSSTTRKKGVKVNV